ncbi:MAG: CapA family protein, partial [Lentilitoribacter sp.]
IATEARAGVAGFDASIYDQIRLLKCEVDILIISVHAAAEMVPWPSPRRQETWRSLVDAGADVVHGHHAHVPQGWEEYNGGLIFYGLGNFCVDPDKWGWHPQGLWSLAPELTKTTRGIAMRPKTTVIDDLGDRIRIREADEAENTMHLTYLHQCNLPLGDSVLLEGLWQEASIKMYTEYFAKWLGFKSPSFFGSNLYIIRRRLERLKNLLLTGQGELDSCGPQRSRYLLWYHLFACDSHNDAIGTALGVLSGELEDMRTNQTAFMIDQLVFKR